MGQRTRVAGVDLRQRGAAGRLARAAVVAAAPLVTRGAAGGGAGELVRRIGGRLVEIPASRHPLSPAAVRVERSRSIRRGRQAEQVAVTVWFGEGPGLPVPGGPGAGRTALRVGASLVGAIALAGATAAAARIAAGETGRLEPPPVPPRLPPGGAAAG